MANEEIIADLRKSIETWDFKLAQSATQRAIDAGMEVGDIIGNGLGKGMETIGSIWQRLTSRHSTVCFKGRMLNRSRCSTSAQGKDCRCSNSSMPLSKPPA